MFQNQVCAISVSTYDVFVPVLPLDVIVDDVNPGGNECVKKTLNIVYMRYCHGGEQGEGSDFHTFPMNITSPSNKIYYCFFMMNFTMLVNLNIDLTDCSSKGFQTLHLIKDVFFSSGPTTIVENAATKLYFV